MYDAQLPEFSFYLSGSELSAIVQPEESSPPFAKFPMRYFPSELGLSILSPLSQY